MSSDQHVYENYMRPGKESPKRMRGNNPKSSQLLFPPPRAENLKIHGVLSRVLRRVLSQFALILANKFFLLKQVLKG